MNSRQLLTHQTLNAFLGPLADEPHRVHAMLEDLAHELVTDRWKVPGEDKLTVERAEELLLDWLDVASR